MAVRLRTMASQGDDAAIVSTKQRLGSGRKRTCGYCAELNDLLQFAQAHSPVCNTVCRPVPVVVERVTR